MAHHSLALPSIRTSIRYCRPWRRRGSHRARNRRDSRQTRERTAEISDAAAAVRRFAPAPRARAGEEEEDAAESSAHVEGHARRRRLLSESFAIDQTRAKVDSRGLTLRPEPRRNRGSTVLGASPFAISIRPAVANRYNQNESGAQKKKAPRKQNSTKNGTMDQPVELKSDPFGWLPDVKVDWDSGCRRITLTILFKLDIMQSR